ncbi:MAG TPA: MarR family transcriptional regulator, partial [Firmicutes bacterium]|nr:MarR family transcriptional regulator [Bacillota bacterium]
MDDGERQTAPDDLAEEIIGSFRTINRGLRRRLAAQGTAALTIPQMIAVRLVAREPGLTLSDLSRRMGLANSTVTSLVDRLERDGLVIRSRDTRDRRVTHLHPTPLALERRERYAA